MINTVSLFRHILNSICVENSIFLSLVFDRVVFLLIAAVGAF